MEAHPIGPLALHAQIERWPMASPFRISGFTFDFIEVVVVTLKKNGLAGRGEAAGVYYRNDTPETMLRQIEAHRRTIESGAMSRESLQKLLPAGGARNALDCALWDLEPKLVGHPAWQIAQLDRPRPLLTTFTCGADEPAAMAAKARSFPSPRAIKIKLTGDPSDADRVRAVRQEKPDAWIGVDANQGFTRASLERLMPVLVDARVELIEQPFPVGQEALLDGFQSPIPVAADESVQSLEDVAGLVGRFKVMNIKLDKCGGLTEGLLMAREARRQGLDTMVGNMLGTSLAMAPAFLVGQLCKVVDLDGPALLKVDREQTIRYIDGHIDCPESLWGGASGGAPR